MYSDPVTLLKTRERVIPNPPIHAINTPMTKIPIPTPIFEVVVINPNTNRPFQKHSNLIIIDIDMVIVHSHEIYQIYPI